MWFCIQLAGIASNVIAHKFRLAHCSRFHLRLQSQTTSILPVNFRRLSKWHFQTNPLPAWNAGPHFPSPLASKSSSLPRGIPTSPSGVPNVVQLARVSKEVTGTPTDHPERCIQRSAPSVARTPWFPSDPGVTNRCTVPIASVE